MYGIDLLVREHEYIIFYTKYVKEICCDILDGKEVDMKALRDCVDFGRNYADKHYHGKEEKILFSFMLEKLGSIAEKLIRNGMLVEHDLGRYHRGELEKAIEQLSNMIWNQQQKINLQSSHMPQATQIC